MDELARADAHPRRPRPVGTAEAFAALFAREFPRVASTIHHIVGDRARAEEVTQDAFLELLRHWDKVRDYDRPDLASVSHYTTWVDACRGEGQTTSHFAYAGPLTETVLLGTIALRHPETDFSWDADRMQLSGDSETAALLDKEYRAW